MADNKAHPTATEMDYPAHHRNYDGFLKLLKWGSILTAIVTAAVIYIIAN
ncbi:aa3-type cytochrome c oxidase subunit IV [Sphingomonas xanthus]|uniref:Aa3-type cytochrome c oxidase subunit IV n=1 Tax=Sphingomonas xanthus TaxID=2594473 RepID=A0A516IU24_9SPHN|nr:aa3-type cytochrome c oxidase subunit IV [Sphingomonas xanthus]QDP20405.1 aa3-type cytochrome c oxidase subunit IV [Sphingomonas xanthus]